MFKKEILQPFETGFKEEYKKTWKMREKMDEQIDKENEKKKKDLDKRLKEKGNKRVLTKEQIILRDLQKEHPTIYEEEKILTWSN